MGRKRVHLVVIASITMAFKNQLYFVTYLEKNDISSVCERYVLNFARLHSQSISETR